MSPLMAERRYDDLEARYINACSQVERLEEENRVLRLAIKDAQRALHSARGSVTGALFVLAEVVPEEGRS